MNKTYRLDGLNCPHCAEKIEHAVASLKGVSAVSLNFMNQTLSVQSRRDLTDKINETVKFYEPAVTISENTQSHPHSHEHEHSKASAFRLIIGAVLFAVSLVFSALCDSKLTVALFIITYALLGYDIVFSALQNIVRGQIFDENFLMSLSSVCALIIGEVPEAVAVMLFYQVGEFFQERAVHSSRKSISSLLSICPDSATVIRNGKAFIVSPDDIAVGEKILVTAGERIALDGIVTDGASAVNTAALTGEAVPRAVTVGDSVLCGFINLSGVLSVEVTHPAGESTADKIIETVSSAAEKKAPAEKFITRFARYYTPIITILACLLAVIPSLIVGNWTEWLHRACVFLVISCPCALVISVPLAFFGGIGAASKRGILVKGGNYLDSLGRINSVVFDKTGTLTTGNFKITSAHPAEGISEKELLYTAAKAEFFSTHPVALSVKEFCNIDTNSDGISNYEELAGRGISTDIDGYKVLAGNSLLMEKSNITVQKPESGKTAIYIARDGKYIGCLILEDEIKTNSTAAIQSLKKCGIKTVAMLTGDTKIAAERVAASLKLDFFRYSLLPNDKVEEIERIKAATPDAVLAFVGDGINDAPCIALSDIGVAMGGLGSEAAVDAADIVLMNDDPLSLCDAVKIARATRKIVFQNIIFSLAVKALFLLLGAAGLTNMWLAVFADVGVALLAVFNSMRILKKKNF